MKGQSLVQAGAAEALIQRQPRLGSQDPSAIHLALSSESPTSIISPIVPQFEVKSISTLKKKMFSFLS